MIFITQQTDKSMVELELELNRRSGEWSALQESGTALRPLHGPRLTGLNNLGNSCYVNSVVQVRYYTFFYLSASSLASLLCA